MRSRAILLSAFLGCASALTAQQTPFRCGFNEMTEKAWANDPQAKADYLQLMARLRQQAVTDPLTRKTTYTIPLVFHIVHTYGSENIFDTQVYDQVNILNQDFRKLNADISNVIPEFENITADANIEFRLAAIDPDGNCTNGIEHIYSHETKIGDHQSKLNMWPRDKYLNIWVFDRMAEGLAGYAIPPSSAGAFAIGDGIAILHQFTGSIGTSSQFTDRTLTHEIGHFLGLLHPSGNEFGTACGDDGLADTPVTKGFDHCPSTIANASICDPNIVENYQNFMEFSFCQSMFTLDQAALMQGVLTDASSVRSSLVTSENLEATGVLLNPAPLCSPVADFSATQKYICEGDAVTFSDVSWNAAVTSRMWYFEGGTPATSTEPMPQVVFNGLGWKSVKLVISNAAGADSIVQSSTVHVSQSWADKTGPYSEDFESGNLLSWLIENPEDNYASWQLSNTNGKDNSRCLKLNSYRDISNAVPFSDEYFYYYRLGGTQDIVVSPSCDLSNTTGPELTFDYAYAVNDATAEQLSEVLKVYSSRNCGKTWTLRKTITSTELISSPGSDGIPFAPTSNTQWKTAVVPFTVNAQDTRTRFKFEFTASDVSNNLYIDNIRITGTLSTNENPLSAMNIHVYPNPATSSNGITINYTANGHPVEFVLTDIQGKILATERNNESQGEINHKINLKSPLSAGLYHVKIMQEGHAVTEKLVIY